ncbi:MAG TPA: prepilin-type N-terminal cleavage/methylation domain-containing protein [Candidatus Paceibacterota bacterium]|jgi:prepilin-type N-terminal cleavage/methylation domain-containing protein|nr:prepilin-type N-terminal cleavage/methylation domain-containing protein [Candidatus Paceibacterota bacterium]
MESIRARTLNARARHAARGFTLVEMLVTLAILAIITAVAITGQSTFNQSILLNDTSYTVALSAREAQSLGLSSRKFAGVQNGGYGVHFANLNPTKSYTVFADVQSAPLAEPAWCPAVATTTPESKSGNCLYDGIGETFQTYDLTRGFTLSDFCGRTTSGGLQCASGGNLQSMDVLYLRPNTQAIITGITPGGAQVQFTCAQVSVKSPTSATTQTVRMSQLGEVSVGQTCP